MTAMTFEQREIRRSMIRKKFTSDRSLPEEMAVTVFDLIKMGRGLSVLFHVGQSSSQLGLREFQRRYPHMIEN